MTAIDPFVNPIRQAVAPPTHTPIYQRLPDTLKAIQNKYNDPEVTGFVQTLPDPIKRSLIEYDVQRASQGQNPLSKNQTLLAAQTALTGKAATSPPTKNPLSVWANTVSDVKALAASIPRIPSALLKEAKDIGQIGEAIGEADTPRELLQLPGVRMIPGTYTAANLLGGREGITEAATHPLFTLLDVLPAAKGLKVGERLGETAAGQLARQAKAGLSRTRGGMFFTEMFGKDARELSRMEATATQRVIDQMNPAGYAYSGNKAVDMAREAVSLPDKFPSIPPDRRVELTSLIQEDPLSIPGLNPVEQGFVASVRDLTDRFGRMAESEGFMQQIDGEYYDASTGSKIINARKQAATVRMLSDIRDLAERPQGLPSISDIRPTVNSTNLSRPQRLNAAEGYAHAIDAAGYDSTPLLESVKRARKSGNLDTLADDFDAYLANPVPVATTPPGELAAQLLPHSRTDGKAAILRDAILKGRYSEAKQIAKGVSRRTKFAIPGLDDTVNQLDRLAKREKYLSRTGVKFSDKQALKAEAKAARVYERNAPARFQPLINKATDEAIVNRYKLIPGNPQTIDEITRHLYERNYRAIAGLGDDEYIAIRREVERTWQEMKDAGLDPVFVHRVSPERAMQMKYPKVLETIKTPTQVKARGIDASETIGDVTVALNHQGLEWLSRRGSVDLVDNMTRTWGRRVADVQDEWRPAAEARARRFGTNAADELDRMIKKSYVTFDPHSIITWSNPKIDALAAENLLLPKSIANNLQRMHGPITNGFTAAMDPVMSAFRVSVLPLSPRWHFYNVFGNSIMSMLRTSPFVYRYMGDAIKIVRGQLDELPEEMRLHIGQSKRDFAEFNYRGGTSLRRIWDQTQAAKALNPVTDAFGKIVNKSFDANAFLDDVHRTMVYLYGKNKALKAGAKLTEDEAAQAGMQLARKTLQDWSSLTPLERSTLRYVFPFYGFMQHIIRYAVHFPIDHPFRSSVLGTFARTELEDFGTSLPEKFLNSFFIGEPDENGNVTTLSLGAMNPFRDVANYFTLAGFVGGLNPIANTIAQQLGIDTSTGAPELYPNLQYDAETGRLGIKTSNPLQGLIENTIPQARILTGLFQSGSEFKQLLSSNPDAARRLLTSQLGLPVILRDVNVPQEQAKAEVKREEAQSIALSDALRTGVDTTANRFPVLAPLLAQIRTLQSQGQLTAYEPPAGGPSNIELAQAALLQKNVG